MYPSTRCNWSVGPNRFHPTMPATVQCVNRTPMSQVLTGIARETSVDLGLHDSKRLGVVVDLDFLALFVVAVDFVAVAVDLELLDLVALRLELRARIRFLHPLALRINRAIGFSERRAGNAQCHA